MKDKIWKPLYAIWSDNEGWARIVEGFEKDGRRVCNDDILIFPTWQKAQKYRRHFKDLKSSTVKALIPYLDWQGRCPKKMKEVLRLTDMWKSVKMREKNLK